MSQQGTLPVTLPPALCKEPFKPVSPPTNIQQEQVKQPTPLPAPCQKVIPGKDPLELGEKHTTPVKEEKHVEQQQQQQESQKQEKHVEQQQQQQESQKQEKHVEQQQKQQESQEQEQHVQQQQQQQQESQKQDQHVQQLEQEKKVLGQRLDQEPAKKDEQLEKKGEQLLEQQEGPLKQPLLVPAPGQVQETDPVQPLKGEVLPPKEAGGVVSPKHM
eukprot:bmy_19013T0